MIQKKLQKKIVGQQSSGSIESTTAGKRSFDSFTRSYRRAARRANTVLWPVYRCSPREGGLPVVLYRSRFASFIHIETHVYVHIYVPIYIHIYTYIYIGAVSPSREIESRSMPSLAYEHTRVHWNRRGPLPPLLHCKRLCTLFSGIIREISIRIGHTAIVR